MENRVLECVSLKNKSCLKLNNLTGKDLEGLLKIISLLCTKKIVRIYLKNMLSCLNEPNYSQ